MKATPAALAALAKGDMDNYFTAATPGGIEAQEAAGQASLVANSQLPGPRMELEKLGIKVGEAVDGLFYSVTLPTGWKKVATDHSMWSDLLDDKGRKRAGIFYKAAFYDRSARISLNCRYTTDHYVPVNESGEAVEWNKNSHFAVVVKDCGQEIHRTGLYEARDYAKSDELEKQAVAWLDEKYPKHDDATAYWD